jgi:hypothetical protein
MKQMDSKETAAEDIEINISVVDVLLLQFLSRLNN